MTLVRFLKPNGTLDREVEAAPGTNLLDLAQNEGQPLEGACEKAMACSTCHVVLSDEDFAKHPVASEEEDDLLDLAAHVTRNSRLACQVDIPDQDTFTVRMPGGSVNLEDR
ncbi:MAG: 2Fe-2S iron-sulfur cluster binding domain-containing protein [Sphingomonas sp.]|nr:2Fe-2S iron-sulfur cluster binding domain-containing protein [Sphingomonas sp.]RZV53416.1 MAG: 2Fe-2S iron-sulfur cluster binding domain-containing protein [Sphingomonadaceae bacterium]